MGLHEQEMEEGSLGSLPLGIKECYLTEYYSIKEGIIYLTRQRPVGINEAAVAFFICFRRRD